MKPAAGPEAPRGRRRTPIRLGLAALGIVAALALALAFAFACVPLPDALQHAPPTSPEFTDRHGLPLREVLADGGSFGRPVPLTAMPAALLEATLAAEDRRFWRHPGVDPLAIARALADLVTRRRVVSGASTITQQLVKLAEPRPRTWRTKLVESAQALRLEWAWPKPRILEAYLNRLDYGNLCRGADAAARFYFGKPVGQLSVAEAALLAGLPNAPSRLNPHRHPERAQQRQRLILARMLRSGRLTGEQHARAIAEPLRLARPRRAFAAPHFVDLVLQGPLPAPTDRRAGPQRTTLDLELNRVAERMLRRHLEPLATRRVRNGAVVVLDNESGDVLALVGSEDYFAPGSGQVNGAWAPRAAGSTLKPFTYLLAFERGLTPATLVADVPTDFATPTGVFRPVNYDRQCHGPVRCRDALANSLNVPAVRVLDDLGGPAVLQPRLVACGLTTLTQSPEHYGLGLTLGNAEVRLLELANAYADLARLGRHRPWRLLPGHPHPAVRVADPAAAWLIADILHDRQARRLAFGDDSPLAFDFPVACKTGTSTDFRDNWALGYTPEFTVGVWVGNFDGAPMDQVSGVTGAAPVLRELLTHLHERRGTRWFATPPGIVTLAVDPLSGRRRAAAGPTLTEHFLARALPPFETATERDAAGRLRLPLEYADWVRSPDNRLPGLVTLASPAPARSPRILFPQRGTVLYLDADLPAASRELTPRAQDGARIEWHSETLPWRADAERPTVTLAPGRHRLEAIDADTGRRAATWIEVRRR